MFKKSKTKLSNLLISIAPKNKNDFLYFFVIGISFFIFASMNLQKPTPNWEEIIQTLPAVSLLKNKPLPLQYDTCKLFSRDWPIMEIQWTGALESYSTIPFYWLFGISISTLRLIEITLCLIIALLFSLLGKLTFGERTQKIAFPLLLFNATFFIYGRMGFEGVILTQWILLSICLITFQKWISLKKIQWACACAFFLGLGMYAKLHFLWITSGLITGWFLILKKSHTLLSYCKKTGNPLPDGCMKEYNLTAGKILLLVSFWALGFSPYIIQNIITGAGPLKTLLHFFLHPVDGTNNFLDYPDNFLTRLIQFRRAFTDGVNFHIKFAWARWMKLSHLIILALPLVPIIRKKIAEIRTIHFFYYCIIIFLLGTSFKGSPLGPNHILTVLPLAVLASAAILDSLIAEKTALFLCALIILIPDFAAIIKYQKSLLTRRADTTLTLTRDLLAARQSVIVINDRKLTDLITFLSSGDLNINDSCRIPDSVASGEKHNIYIMTISSTPQDPINSDNLKQFIELSKTKNISFIPVRSYMIDSNMVLSGNMGIAD